MNAFNRTPRQRDFPLSSSKGLGSLPVLICTLAFLLLPARLVAESYRFMDESGNIYFVDSLSQVPAQYRNQVVAQPTPGPEMRDRRYLRELERQRKLQEKLEKQKQKEKEKKKAKKARVNKLPKPKTKLGSTEGEAVPAVTPAHPGQSSQTQEMEVVGGEEPHEKASGQP